MSDRDRNGGGASRRRFRTQAWVLGGLAIAIYVGYLAFMVVKGIGGV